MEQESAGHDEHGDECLQFTDDLSREPASQEGEPSSFQGSSSFPSTLETLMHQLERTKLSDTRNVVCELRINILLMRINTENGLSVPSDASLSPASQNSPYSITPVSQGSPASSGIGSPMASNAVTKIHSRRFRE